MPGLRITECGLRVCVNDMVYGLATHARDHVIG